MSLFYNCFSLGKYKFVFFLIFVYHINYKYVEVSNIFERNALPVLNSEDFRLNGHKNVKRETKEEHKTEGGLNNYFLYAEFSNNIKHNAVPVRKSDYFRTNRPVTEKHKDDDENKRKGDLKYILTNRPVTEKHEDNDENKRKGDLKYIPTYRPVTEKHEDNDKNKRKGDLKYILTNRPVTEKHENNDENKRQGDLKYILTNRPVTEKHEDNDENKRQGNLKYILTNRPVTEKHEDNDENKRKGDLKYIPTYRPVTEKHEDNDKNKRKGDLKYILTNRPVTEKHENNDENKRQGDLKYILINRPVTEKHEDNDENKRKGDLKYILTNRPVTEKHEDNDENKRKGDLKYILQWTRANSVPFVYMGVGQQGFVDNDCTYTNCYVTSDRKFFSYITTFDVIAFAGPEIRNYEKNNLPALRAPHQKYVFANIESSASYPVCSKEFDGYFNWTWTFKLDSDSRWGYLAVRDHKGTIIGPNKIMHWIKHEDMQPVPEDLKEILRGKTRTAAWFVSSCNSMSKRETYVEELQKVLSSKYSTTVDIYGRCGNFQCPRNNEIECDEILRSDYFFYLSFENSFSEDYVTEKLVRPLKFNTLPIVFGGANYSRFLPEGSYINAASLKHEELADKMHALMNNFEEYLEYFRWTNHYNYHNKNESPQTNDYCAMCALLNDKSRMKEKTVYENFRQWWNQPYDQC